MASFFICLLALAAYASAQLPSITPLSDGVQVTKSIGPSRSAFDIDEYAFTVTENIGEIYVAFSHDGICAFFDVYVKSDAPVCDPHQYTEEGTLCAYGQDLGPINSVGFNKTIVAGARDPNSFFEWKEGTWYFAVARELSTDQSKNCTYRLQVGSGNTCPAGTVGIAQDLTSATSSNCSDPYMEASYGESYTISKADNNSAEYQVFKLEIAQNTGHITIVLTSSSTSSQIYGRSYGSPTENDGGYECFTASSVSTASTSTYTLNCYVPRSGDFYVIIVDPNTYSGSVVFSQTVCSGNTGGFNCTYPSTPVSSIYAPSGTFTAKFANSSPGVAPFNTAWYYAYFDITSDLVGQTYVFTATSSDAGVVIVRRNGFPENSNEFGYENGGITTYQTTPGTVQYVLNEYDLDTNNVGDRIFFGLGCTSQTGCTFNAFVNGTSSIQVTTGYATSASAASTTTTTTTASTSSTSTTTGHSSGGSVVAPLLAFVFTALLL